MPRSFLISWFLGLYTILMLIAIFVTDNPTLIN